MSSSYVWFIDPKGDERSNALVAAMLGSNAGENECWEQVCSDREPRQLWRCPHHDFIVRFERTARMQGYAYDVYCRHGRNGQIRLWKFGRRTRIRRRHHTSLLAVGSEEKILSPA